MTRRSELTVAEHAELHKDKNVGELAAYDAAVQDGAPHDATWGDLVGDITWGEFTEMHKDETWGELRGEEN